MEKAKLDYEYYSSIFSENLLEVCKGFIERNAWQKKEKCGIIPVGNKQKETHI
jgi:hypothetical protein